MLKLALTQLTCLMLLALGAYILGGMHWMISVLLGGFSYVIPTVLAMLLMYFLKPYPSLAGVSLIGSTGLKMVLSLILMVASFYLYPNIHFLSFFIGLLAVSHLVFLLFLKVHRYGK